MHGAGAESKNEDKQHDERAPERLLLHRASMPGLCTHAVLDTPKTLRRALRLRKAFTRKAAAKVIKRHALRAREQEQIFEK